MFFNLNELVSRGWTRQALVSLLEHSDVEVNGIAYYRFSRVIAIESTGVFGIPGIGTDLPPESLTRTEHPELDQVLLDPKTLLPAGGIIDLARVRREASYLEKELVGVGGIFRPEVLTSTRIERDVLLSAGQAGQSIQRPSGNDFNDVCAAIYLRELLRLRSLNLLAQFGEPLGFSELLVFWPYADLSICLNYPELIGVLDRNLGNWAPFAVDLRSRLEELGLQYP